MTGRAAAVVIASFAVAAAAGTATGAPTTTAPLPPFARGPEIAVGGDANAVPVALAAADLNGDGLPDLAVTGNAGTLSLLYNRGRGSFAVENLALKPASAVFDGPWFGLALGDLNGDRKPDLAIADVLGGVTILRNQTGAAVRRRRALAHAAIPGFAVAGVLGVGTAADRFPNARDVAVGDLDGDGRPDLAVADESGAVSVLLNRGPAGFSLQENSLVTAADPHPFADGIAIADVNGDGRPDLAVAEFDGQAISVLLNEGGGTFALQPKTSLVTTAQPQPAPVALTAGDLNGDGRPDLAVADLHGQEVSVLLNRGAGAFSVRQVPLANAADPRPFPSWVAIGDLNGDGKPDLAVADASGAVSLLANHGAGRFALSRELRLASAADRYPIATAVAIADLNSDRRPDLAVAMEAGFVSLLLNRPPSRHP